MTSDAIRLRRELHENPEIGFDLDRTLAILRRELDGIGVEYTEKYGKSSIVATVNPEKDGFTIGVRADIDALPITEANDVPYKSKICGQMHACGHDAHAAIAMETLRRVYAARDEIGCRVKFLFQSAEEYTTSGAKLMSEDGVMDGIDCIVALHCDTNFRAGEIGIIENEMNAQSDGFMIDFFGKSSHAANQEKGVDAIMMAMRAYADIEFLVAKTVAAKEPVIFNVGSIHGGVTNNVICDKCSMFCTLRTWNEATADRLLGKIRNICQAVADTADGSYTYTTCKKYPIVKNDPRLTKYIRAAAAAVVGEENIKQAYRALGGEDFSYFANQKPGFMYRLGVKNVERGIVAPIHNANFDIDEDALEVGVRVFERFIRDNDKGIAF